MEINVLENILSVEEISKIKQIEKDCISYIKRHKKMPTSFNLSYKEFDICQKARSLGYRLKVWHNGVDRIVPIRRGF